MEVTKVPGAVERLLGYAIDLPRPGPQPGAFSLDVGGWALGRDSGVEAVEAVAGEQLQRRISLRVPRPDVLEHYPDVSGSPVAGFSAVLGVLGLAPEFELELVAVLEHGDRIPVGAVRGRRPALGSSYEARRQPVMVTMLGRVGSTLLMRILDQHPGVVIHPPHQGDPYETRVATYWLHLLRVLAEPANHEQSSPLASFNGDLWRVGHNPFFARPVTLDPEVRDWFDRLYPRMLADLSLRSIDDFYERVARRRERTSARYFAEKFHPDHVPWLAWDLYPGAREVVLVRDPRDMIASIRAFNAKRGYDSFGRENLGSDVEYVGKIARDLRRLAQSWRLRSGSALLVRYEDMVLRPARVVERLLAYLELPAERKTIEGIVSSAFEESPELNRHKTVRDPRASVGRWKRDLEPELKVACHEQLGTLLEEFGYVE